MPQTIQEQIRAEEEKMAAAEEKIRKLKAKDAERIGRIADRVGFYGVTVSDEQLADGLRHAMALAQDGASPPPG